MPRAKYKNYKIIDFLEKATYFPLVDASKLRSIL
jgi:hypothetical protein